MGHFSVIELAADPRLAVDVSPDQPISQNSRFGDSTWDLGSLVHIKNVMTNKKKLIFDFLLPDGSRFTDPPNAVLYTSTKEFCYWRLQGHPPIHPVKATTLFGEFTRLRLLIFWMIANKHYAYSHLCPHHIEVQFLNSLRDVSEDRKTCGNARADAQIVLILNIVQRLWAFQEKMSDSLTFNPFNGKSPRAVLGVECLSNEENRTPRIPDEIMIPLGNEALDYVYLYSSDILNARAQIEIVREELQALNTCKGAFGVRGDILFNVYQTSHHAEAALSRISITCLPSTGKPWREPFSQVHELYQEEAYLLAACYIVIAWLTGMRESEITSLREDCLRRELSEDGIIERLKVKGRLFKGVSDARGREETWVVIEPVAKAIEVLTLLTKRLRARAQGDITELFLVGDRRITIDTPRGDSLRYRLQKFAEHAKLPLVDGKVWKLGSRQFRRTLARWIARRPFGELAGMIQFKHLELSTFEGYAGRDPDFRRLLAEEKLLGNIDLLGTLKHEALAGNVAGPKAPELIATFRGIAGDRRADDEAYMLKHLAKTLYVGPFNLCFYDPAYAMCQQHLPIQERKSPITSHCQPDRCPNSCITKQHLGIYQIQLDESKRLLKTPKLPIPQRIALEQESERIERLVGPLLDSSER